MSRWALCVLLAGGPHGEVLREAVVAVAVVGLLRPILLLFLVLMTFVLVATVPLQLLDILVVITR
jgi:hypothetical protein